MEYIPIIKRKEIHKVLLAEILYIEQYQRKIRLITEEVTYEIYGKMQGYLSYLGDNFMECHRSLYVNMDQVQSMKDQKVFFFGGREIPLSRDKYTGAKQRFSRYIISGGNSQITK